MLRLSHIRCLLSSSLVFTTKTKSFIVSSYTRLSITRCDWFWRRSLSAMASQYISKVYEEKDIQKSAEDARQYRALELTNDMKVLLVSDPVTDKASAAMDVNVGYFQDPWELPGLAHFCEHMLFLGTEKYKEENEYTKFLNEHGGSSNAYTSGEHTNFYFDISSGELGGALDRFAQFFTCPLFTASATDREVNAVNSENDKNLQSDPWRLHQLDKSLANPNHDYSKFGTGNKDTLDAIPKSKGINVRDELLNYHSKFYSSNIMGLCVVGKESLDELTEMVVPLFSKVENKKVAVPEWKTHPFGPEEMKKFYYVVPVKDLRSLSMSWSIPDLHPYYHSNPGHYLGHLVGHEGEGSLLSELKTRGWVNTLCGGQSSGAKGFMFFKVDVDLTEDGIEHIDDIITLTCQYINMLRKEGAQEWVFEECQNLSAMTFRFKDKEKPRSYSTSLAGIIHQYPIHEVLCGPYLMTEYRPDLINMVLEKLTPDNMRIGVVAKKYAGVVDKKEKWYETEYKLEDIPEEKLKKWANCGMHENLKLPPRNEFIPTNFEIVARESDNPLLPEMIKESGMTRLWFKQDDKFLLPKACVNFEITSPIAYADPANCNMTYLFVTLFKDALNEYAYDAEIAGLGYGLECTIYGLTLALRGYHEKQHVLLRKVLEKFTTFTIDPKRFEIFKEMYMRGLKNFNAEQPHQHAIYYTNVLMSEVMWTKEELLHSVEDLTADMVQAFIPHLLSKLYIEGLIYGNVTKQKAVEMADMVESIFKQSCETKELLPSQHKRFREVQMPDGCFYLHQRSNQVHKSCSIEIYYQCGMQETQSNMLLELFVQIIGEPCFNILRTQEQLGYIVFTGIRRASGIQGLRVIIQSDRSPKYVDDRVEAFLCYIDKYIEEMAQEAFEKHVTALVAKRMEQPKKISVQNQKFWSEIVSNLYNFDRDNIEVAFLKTIQKDDLYKFFKDNIAYDAPHRHKLSIHIESTAEGANNTTSVPSPETNGTELSAAPELPQPIMIEDISEFKRDRGLYPLPKPFIDLRKAKSKL